ncbi:DUF637 domain-containing protein [Aeromonas sanarellii]|uniref:DUF637 domain-containing protein n=1 Tax=Aeromonas sanarellii TaxID=633415 RepID=UPI003BA1D471
MRLGGQLRTGANLMLGATLLELSGAQSVGGALQLHAGRADLASKLEVGEGLSVKTQALSSRGEVVANAADIEATEWVQQGTLSIDEALVWRGARLIQQNQGVLQAGGAVSLTGEQVSLAGTLAAKGSVTASADSYTQLGRLHVGQGLTIDADALQLSGTTQAKTALLRSRSGESSGQHLITEGLEWQSDKLANRGWLQAGSNLTLTTRTLDNAGTVIAGGVNTISAQARLNNQGSLAGKTLSLTAGELQSGGVLQGKQGLALNAEQATLTGRLTSQGAVRLGASLLALGGEAEIDGPLTLQAGTQRLGGTWRVGGLLQSTGKQLTVDGDWQASRWQLTADTLTNQGRLASEQAANVNVGAVHNQQGATLVAGGPLTLTGKSLLQEGTWLGAGEQHIQVEDVQQRGQWVSEGALQVGGAQFTNTGTLRAASMVLKVDALTNPGRMESGGAFAWTGEHWHNTGTLIAGQATLLGQTLLNLGEVGAGHLSMTAQERLENGGVLVGKEGMRLTAATLDSSGDVLSNGALAIQADQLSLTGVTQAQGELNLTAAQVTLAGTQVVDRLQWQGQHLTLAGTTLAREAVLSGQDITLDGALKGDSQTLSANTLTTGAASQLLARTSQQLTAEQMTLQGSVVAGFAQRIQATALAQHGVLASGGELALQAAQTLRNEGNISSDTLRLAAANIDNGGALVSKEALSLQTGELVNRGHWQSDKGITLTATKLLNSGQWVSGLAQQLTLGELDNSGTLLAGTELTLTAQHLGNRGKLLASQSMTLTADDMQLASGSTTASNGQLSLRAADVTSAGMLSAAGDLHWQGQRFYHSGTAVTDGTLQLQGDALTLDGILQGAQLTLDTDTLTSRGTLISRGDVTVTAKGAVQHDGQLHGNHLTLTSASWQGAGAVTSQGALTLRTGQLQLQGPWRIRGTADIQADDITLGGSLVSGGDLTLLGRSTVTSQVSSQLIAGDTLSVQGSTLTQQGLWQSEQGMGVKGDTFEQRGDLLAGADFSLRADTWQQHGTTRAMGALHAELTQGATLNGAIQADTGLTLSAPSLTLQGALASGGDISLSATALIAQLGTLLSGGTLTLAASRIDQQGRIETTHLQSRGELHNTGILLVAGQGDLSGSRLDNQGTLQGQALTLTSQQLDNSGLLLGGSLAITSDEVTNRGHLQSDTLTISTQRLDNTQGAVLRAQRQGDITATTLTNAGELSSQGRLALHGDQLINSNTGLVSANWLEASPLARLSSSGTLFASEMTLRSAELDIPGKLLARQRATLEAGKVTGIGEWLSGGDLSLKTGSSLTSQGILSARSTLALDISGDWLHQGQWGAGLTLNATTTGHLDNQGSLVSNGSVQLTASQLTNSGSLQAGDTLQVDTPGALTNTGVIASLGDQTINAGTLHNTGTLYSENHLALTASSNLTNQYGTLLGEQGASIEVTNGQLLNASGTIDAGSGDLWLSARGIINKRAIFEFTQSSSTGNSTPLELTLDKDDTRLPEHRFVWKTIAFIPSASYLWMGGVEFSGNSDVSVELSRSGLTVEKDSKAGDILAAGNATITADTLLNDASRIAVGGNLDITAATLTNKSYQLGGAVEYADYHYQSASGLGFGETRPVVEGPPSLVPNYKLHYTLGGTRSEQISGASVDALISAGGNLTGTVAGMIDNVTIKANAGPVSSTTARPTLSLPQVQDVGAAPDLQADAQTLSQTLTPVGPDNGVALPDFPLPTGDKGLFTVNTSGDSPYLIEVNPLLANLGQAGDDMQARIDAALAQQLQGAGPLAFDGIETNEGIAQAVGQGNAWSLPTRTADSPYTPATQSLDKVASVSGLHAGSATLLQQRLQPGTKAPGVAGVSVASPGAVQLTQQSVPAITTAPKVETSPTLTQVNKFLGSSYFFAQVGFTPEKDIKLLGDAAFDTRVIRDAILAQTGRRFINGETGTDLAQMQLLIDNATRNQQTLGLTPGMALTAAQVAQLGRSMVWWEPVWYQGKIVLAPKLYLSEADKRHLSGSTITAKNIDLTAGSINNSGTLLADGTLTLKSQSTLTNQGTLQAGGNLTLLAMGDIRNQGRIKGQDVRVASANGSIINETQTAQRHVDVNGILSDTLTDQTRFSRTDIGDIARIESAGNLLLQAGKDIHLSAAELLAGNHMALQAGNDISVTSQEDRSKWEAGQDRFARVNQLMSSLNAGGNLSLTAANDLAISASRLRAQDDLSLRAGHDIFLATEANQTSDEVKKGSKHTIDRTTTQQGTTLTGDNVTLKAGNDLLAQASTITARDNVSLQAGNELQLLTADNEVYHFEKSKSSSTFKSKTTEIEQRDTTAQGTTLQGANVTLKSQGDMTLTGSTIQATDTLTLDTAGQLALLTATDSHFYRKDEKKSGIMVKMSGNGENSTTEHQNQLSAADINISAGQGVLLQVGQREGESQQANLDTLAASPETAWVKQVTQMPGVKLAAVQEAYEQWDYSQQSLSPIAASIIAIVVAVATAGAGVGALAAMQGVSATAVSATAAAMAEAAVTTLATQATISTINNGGDLGAVLKEMGSSATISQLATAVATAGALQGIDSAFDLQSASSTANNKFMQPGAADLMSWETFARVTSHSTLSAGIDSTINGTRFGDSLKASLLANIQSEIGQSTAGLIGDNGEALGKAGKTLAHGLTSGAIAEITGGKFAAGLAAGAMSELASEASNAAFDNNQEAQVALNKILGGLAAAAVTGDETQFDVGADRAETVYRYNNLVHALAALKARDPERHAQLIAAKQDQFRACGESAECKNTAIASFGVLGLPVLPSGALLAAGIGGSANTGFQLWSNGGDLSKVDAREAVLATYLSAGTAGWGFWSTVGANSAGGVYMSHLKGEDPLTGGIASGVGASIGYGVGKIIETPLNRVFNPNWKNYDWVDLGLGMSKQPLPDMTPSTVGNIANSISSESSADMTKNASNKGATDE